MSDLPTIGDRCRHRVGELHERTIEIEYIGEKDGKATVGGPVLDSTEPDEIVPDRGWTYIDQIIGVDSDGE